MAAPTSTPPSLARELLRASDRLITPTTVCAGLLAAVLLTLGLTALVVLGHSDAQLVVDVASRVLVGLGSLVTPLIVAALKPQIGRMEAHYRAAATPSEDR